MLLTAAQIYELFLLALCIWREASGETIEGKYAQAWSIRNRAFSPAWWGHDWISCILKPYQYSSFNRADPNAVKFPSPDESAWVDCQKVAEDVYFEKVVDPTGGATSYFDSSLDANPPAWSTDGSNVKTVNVGNLRFFRRA